MLEQWREIPGYPGYEASNLGFVRSWRSNNGGLRERPNLLRARLNARGYLQVTRVNRQSVTRKVHTLVLLAFEGPGPQGHEVDHRNRVRQDNRPGNLRWVLPTANARNRSTTILDEETARLIRQDYVRGVATYRSLGVQYGVSPDTIGDVVRYDTWR